MVVHSIVGNGFVMFSMLGPIAASALSFISVALSFVQYVVVLWFGTADGEDEGVKLREEDERSE